jgi:hypothetical protein
MPSSTTHSNCQCGLASVKEQMTRKAPSGDRKSDARPVAGGAGGRLSIWAVEGPIQA